MRGHSVSTRKDEFDFGDILATGETGIFAIDGLVKVCVGVATACEALFGVVVVVVVVGAGVWGPFAGVTTSVKVPFSSRMEKSKDAVDFRCDSEGVTAASAGNKKFLCTDVGSVRYAF